MTNSRKAVKQKSHHLNYIHAIAAETNAGGALQLHDKRKMPLQLGLYLGFSTVNPILALHLGTRGQMYLLPIATPL